MLIFYHATPTRNRASIRKHGLLPRDTTKHTFAGAAHLPDNEGVEAVYVTDRIRDSYRWITAFGGHYSRESFDESFDVWEIAVEHTDFDDDPHWCGARIRAHVPPSHMRVVWTGGRAEAGAMSEPDPVYDAEEIPF